MNFKKSIVRVRRDVKMTSLLWPIKTLFENWKTIQNKHFLLEYILPTEDIEIINILNQNINSLENYNFSNIINKYNVEDFIICLIYKDNRTAKVLSKININNQERIQSNIYNNINITKNDELENLILSIKSTFEDDWKKFNQINRSVKLALNITIDANDYKKNQIFEKFLDNTEFVSSFFIMMSIPSGVHYYVLRTY